MRKFMTLAGASAVALALLVAPSAVASGPQAFAAAKTCVKEKRAVKKADTKTARSKARKALRQCRKDEKSAKPTPAPSPSPAAAPSEPDPAQIVAQATEAANAEFRQAHGWWVLMESALEPGDSFQITPTCKALTSSLATCEIFAYFASADGVYDITRNAKATVDFYPLGVDAVLSEETCHDAGIVRRCGADT